MRSPSWPTPQPCRSIRRRSRSDIPGAGPAPPPTRAAELRPPRPRRGLRSGDDGRGNGRHLPRIGEVRCKGHGAAVRGRGLRDRRQQTRQGCGRLRRRHVRPRLLDLRRLDPDRGARCCARPRPCRASRGTPRSAARKAGARMQAQQRPLRDGSAGGSRRDEGGGLTRSRSGPPRTQLRERSTIRPLVIQGIIARSFSPTCSI